MAMNRNKDDWAQQVPERRYRSEYEDYGWESGESVLPEFRAPEVHELPYEQQRIRREPRGGGRFERAYSYEHRDLYPRPDEEPSELGYGSGYALEDDAFRFGQDWTAPGPHTGRGPRGYQRSDERIRDEVCERLTRHGRIDATDVSVSVKDGEVTLSGNVGSRPEKRMSEDTAESVTGVRDVHNELHIAKPQS